MSEDRREDEEGTPHGKALVDACKGSAGGRALAHATGCPNDLWKQFLYTEGELILKGATLLQPSRVPEAMVVQESLEPLAPLRSQCAEAASGNQGGEATVPWLQDPEWLYLPHLQAERGLAGGQGNGGGGSEEGGGVSRDMRKGPGGHLLRTTGPLIWCARCACHALQRHGTGLKGECVARKNDATNKRLQRLHAGKHPVSGRPLK